MGTGAASDMTSSSFLAAGEVPACERWMGTATASAETAWAALTVGPVYLTLVTIRRTAFAVHRPLGTGAGYWRESLLSRAAMKVNGRP